VQLVVEAGIFFEWGIIVAHIQNYAILAGIVVKC